MATLAAGAEAPPFSLKDQHGAVAELHNLKGGWVILYFYPKDDTPGCTREACSFRDNHEAIEALGAVVLGVSADGSSSHVKFANKYALPFQLLTDEADHGVARAYGAFGTKVMYGRTYEGVFRSTFAINPAGQVAKVWSRVKPERHGEEVLAWLRAATGG